MPLDHQIEYEILITLLKIVARERKNLGEAGDDSDMRECFDEAIEEVVDDQGGSGADIARFKNEFPSLLRQLILRPILDAELLELLRLVLMNNGAAIKELIMRLINDSFPNDKRLAVVKILCRALERGNDGAEKVLTKVLSALQEKAELSHIKRNVLEAIIEVSDYTARYYNIIEPKFNPTPRLDIYSTRGNSDDKEKS